MKKTRINLVVPYSEKDTAKSIGCRWDGDDKLWYIMHPHYNRTTHPKLYYTSLHQWITNEQDRIHVVSTQQKELQYQGRKRMFEKIIPKASEPNTDE